MSISRTISMLTCGWLLLATGAAHAEKECRYLMFSCYDTDAVSNQVMEVLSTSQDRVAQLTTVDIKDARRVDHNLTFNPEDQTTGKRLKASVLRVLYGHSMQAVLVTHVRIGIDLSQVKVSVQDRVISVLLPAADVQEITLDFDNSLVVSQRVGLLNSSEDMFEILRSLFLEHERAIRSDFLGKADLNAYARKRASDVIETLIGPTAKDLRLSLDIGWVTQTAESESLPRPSDTESAVLPDTAKP